MSCTTIVLYKHVDGKLNVIEFLACGCYVGGVSKLAGVDEGTSFPKAKQIFVLYYYCIVLYCRCWWCLLETNSHLPHAQCFSSLASFKNRRIPAPTSANKRSVVTVLFPPDPTPREEDRETNSISLAAWEREERENKYRERRKQGKIGERSKERERETGVRNK